MCDPGTTTFMIMSCALVLMMGPALALFYGGLSRRKNVVSTMLMCVMAMGAVGCLWAILGDSIAYGGPDAFDEDGNLVNAAALFVGGIVGCILTGIFAIPELSFNGLGGLLYTGDPTLLINQCFSVLVTVVYVGAATAIIGLVAKALFSGSLRVGKDEETRDLDTTVHGESGYPSFTGLDQ